MATFSSYGRRNAHVRPSLVPHAVHGSFSVEFRIFYFGRGAVARAGNYFSNRHRLTYGEFRLYFFFWSKERESVHDWNRGECFAERPCNGSSAGRRRHSNARYFFFLSGNNDNRASHTHEWKTKREKKKIGNKVDDVVAIIVIFLYVVKQTMALCLCLVVAEFQRRFVEIRFREYRQIHSGYVAETLSKS